MSYRGGKRRIKAGVVPAVLVFALDIVWMLVVGAVFSVWVYRVNNGTFRWFIAASAVGGFAVWHATLGRVVLFFAEAIAAFLRRLLALLFLTPIRWLARQTGRCAGILWRVTGRRLLSVWKRRRAIRRTERFGRMFHQDVTFGERGERS